MRALLAALLLLTVAFAGCADGGKEDPAPTSSSSSSSSASATRTGSTTATGSTSATGTAAPANRAPVGSISAKANGTTVEFNLTGSDPDGDALTWTLTMGDGSHDSDRTGTSLPANVTHAYLGSGNYTVVYNLTDGQATASYNLTIAINAAAPSLVTQGFVGEWSIGNVDAPAVAALGGDCDGAESMDGLFVALFTVEPATIGRPYTATIEATTTSASIVAWEVKFRDAECQEIDGPYIEGSGPITGTVPAGAVYAWMSSDGGAGLTGTYQTS